MARASEDMPLVVTVICGFWRLVDFHVYKIPTNRLIGLWEFFDAVILY